MPMHNNNPMLFDVVTEDDEPTGEQATFEELHQKGLWHRGVHIIIYTPDKQIVIQKRAPTLSFHPNEIEIGVGGLVDGGEDPLEAVIRETREEIGINLSANDITFLSKQKYNHTGHIGTNRYISYCYKACVPLHSLQLIADPAETAEVALISIRKMKRSLRTHRIKNLGRVSGQYAYWRHLLASI